VTARIWSWVRADTEKNGKSHRPETDNSKKRSSGGKAALRGGGAIFSMRHTRREDKGPISGWVSVKEVVLRAILNMNCHIEKNDVEKTRGKQPLTQCPEGPRKKKRGNWKLKLPMQKKKRRERKREKRKVGCDKKPTEKKTGTKADSFWSTKGEQKKGRLNEATRGEKKREKTWLSRRNTARNRGGAKS